MNQTGMSTLTILAGIPIAVACTLAAGSALRNLSTSTARTLVKNANVTNAAIATETLVKNGRMAIACQKAIDTVTHQVGLECILDFQNTGNVFPFTNVRFEMGAPEGLTNTLVQKRRSGNSRTEVWVTVLRYSGISSFDLCDSNDMNNPGSCPIDTNFSGVSNRFFRFKLTTVAMPRQNNTGDLLLIAQREFKGSFFVRNNGPTGTTIYQWGSID